jgi:hypothetical protein
MYSLTDFSTGGANAGLSEKGGMLFGNYHLNYYSEDFYSNFRATKDEKATCGKKPYLIPNLCTGCNCNNPKIDACKRCCETRKKEQDANAVWQKCIEDVRAYNLSVHLSGGGGSGTGDTTPAPPPPPTDTTTAPPSSGAGGGIRGKITQRGGQDIQQAGMMGGKTIMWVIIALVLLGLIYMGYKKFSTKAQ